MLLTACYVYLFFKMRRIAAASLSPEAALILGALRSAANSASLAFSRERGPCALPRPRGQEAVRVACGGHGRVCELIQPKALVDVSGWTRTGAARPPGADRVAFLVEVHQRDHHQHHHQHHQHHHQHSSPARGETSALLWSPSCVPLALGRGQPRLVLAEATEEAFSRLGAEFLTLGLHLDSGEEADSLISVDFEGFLGPEADPCEETGSMNFETSEEATGDHTWHRHSGQCSAGTKLNDDHEETWEPEVTVTRLPRPKGAVEAAQPHSEARDAVCHVDGPQEAAVATSEEEREDNRPLHLSSCCECLEMESSTIESVRFASTENLVELPHDGDEDGRDDERTSVVEPGCWDASAAERGEVSGRERQEEPATDARKVARDQGYGSWSKPPNVLVYTGQDGPDADRRFELLRAALRSVLRPDHYTVYRLEEAPARAHPWPDHTRLLVLASPRPLPEEMSERFLSYASRGGAVLATCSRVSWGSVRVVGGEEAEGARVAQPIRFLGGGGRKPEVILNAPTDGVIVGVGGDGADVTATLEDTGCVEVWARLVGSGGEALIVRQAYGEEGGILVLSQVDLTGFLDGVEGVSAADGQARCKVLAEVLGCLGLACGPSDDVPALTPAVLWALEPRMKHSLLSALEPRLSESGVLASRRVSLRFVRTLADGGDATPSLLPVVTDASPDHLTPLFDLEAYRGALHTRLLGRLVLHCQVVGSTMELFDGISLHLPEDVGLIAIATRQTQGKGRGRNAWLSPVGCAMFTLPLVVRTDSRLGQHLPFLQHLVALAAVESVRTTPGYEDIDLRVKWPNDIYYRSEVKLGGVLVNSTLTGDTFRVLVGCGINVSNDHPTWSVNAAVEAWNREGGNTKAPLALLSTAGVIAGMVTQLERLVDAVQAGGPAAVLPLYYQRWLHSGTQVRLHSDTGLEAMVLGLDEFGFLRVLSQDGATLTLQPDGNSFDMTRNLIVCKQ